MEAETEGERLVDAKSTKQIGPDAAHYGPGHQIVGRTRAEKERKRASERARATVRKTNRIFSPEIHTDRLVAVVRARASGIPVRHPHFPQSRANGRRRK